MPIRVVGFDGDDTLWHSETRFSVTQAEFRELLKRHVPDADVDARLSEMEMKNVDTYRGVFQRRGIKPEEFVMVGNSLRSDLVPVVELGGRAVHIPYEVTWHHEHVPDDELPAKGWRRASSIRELPAALEDL